MFAVLLGGEHLLEQGLELRLAKDATRFDIGEDTLQIPDALCQALHVTQSLVDLLEPFCDLLETLAEP